MNVSLVFPGCHRRGGVERVVYECAQFLGQRGHDVEVVCRDFEPTGLPSIRCVPVKSARRPGFREPGSFFRHSTQVIAGRGNSVLGTHGCVCPVGGVHWVQSVHQAWLERSANFRTRFSLPRLKQFLNPFHAAILRLENRHFKERRYQRLIATTAQVREDLHRLYGVPKTDVTLIPNGFNPTEFSLDRRLERRESVRREMQLGQDEVVWIFVANELERKGYPTLLKAIARLGDPQLRLLVVGRASQRDARRVAAAHGLADRVLVCGATADISSFHAAADAFVLPTQYEALSLAILEALGSGLPVVTTSVPGAGDAIVENVNGLLIRDPLDDEELADAMRKINDPLTRDRMSRNAPATVVGYRWPTVLSQYEAVLESFAS